VPWEQQEAFLTRERQWAEVRAVAHLAMILINLRPLVEKEFETRSKCVFEKGRRVGVTVPAE
jgi:hypothetical protein